MNFREKIRQLWHDYTNPITWIGIGLFVILFWGGGIGALLRWWL